MAVEKKVIPSSIVGVDYTEALAIQYRSKHNITNRIMATVEARMETDTIGENRTDKVMDIGIKASYTPLEVLSLRYIRRKKKKPPKRHKTKLKIDVGINSRSRTSDEPTYEFSQLKVFAGVSVIY